MDIDTGDRWWIITSNLLRGNSSLGINDQGSGPDSQHKNDNNLT